MGEEVEEEEEVTNVKQEAVIRSRIGMYKKGKQDT